MKPGRRISGAALAGMLWCPWCLAAGEGDAMSWVLPPGSWREPIAGAALLHGAPADILYYEAPLEAMAMIAYFEKHHPDMRDLTVLPGMAVLSRVQGTCTRVATVAGLGKGRSAGTLSQVCWAEPQALGPADWLPSGGQRIFDFSEQAGGFSQQVWRYAQSMGEVRAAMRQGLMRQGWRRATERAGGMEKEEWERNGRRLVLELFVMEQGCALAMLDYAEPGASAANASREQAR